ncbi:hypothetical protein [Stenotrophomonas sp. PS02289]|uniref:hypothetical protein n=1 Tax=Stenotrophomonas sp. PS02289 TaxID=2991422 RepID=UPI00249B5659|nr:hypothetical protein [Stenotrophomonas sp. PS02289]
MNTDLVHSFRITKYATLGPNGARTSPPSEWTAFSDVGRLVTLADYLQVESAYLQAIETACTASGATALRVKALDGNRARGFTEGQCLELTQALEMARQVLREACWCKLVAERMEVHFGYDYYMYVVAADDILMELESAAPSLFVERYPSPYLQPMDEADIAL